MPAADGLDAPDLPLALEPEESEEPDVPDAPDADVPLLPDEVSELLDGMALELLPLAPGVFCEGIVEDGEVALLPDLVSAPEPALCASTTEDTDATITKDNDRSVVFNGICDSFC